MSEERTFQFDCSVQPVLMTVVTCGGTQVPVHDVVQTYNKLLDTVPDLFSRRIVNSVTVASPFFVKQELVPKGIVRVHQHMVDGKVIKETFEILDGEALQESAEAFLNSAAAADYQAPNLSDGPVRVSMAPAMIPMVTIDDQEWETSSFPAYLIRETFACFNAAYPIPVGEFVNETGRSENDFSDKRFLEYLVQKDYVRKATTSLLRDTYYWIHDEESFQKFRNQIESLLAGLEKGTGK